MCHVVINARKVAGSVIFNVKKFLIVLVTFVTLLVATCVLQWNFFMPSSVPITLIL